MHSTLFRINWWRHFVSLYFFFLLLTFVIAFCSTVGLWINLRLARIRFVWEISFVLFLFVCCICMNDSLPHRLPQHMLVENALHNGWRSSATNRQFMLQSNQVENQSSAQRDLQLHMRWIHFLKRRTGFLLLGQFIWTIRCRAESGVQAWRLSGSLECWNLL